MGGGLSFYGLTTLPCKSIFNLLELELGHWIMGRTRNENERRQILEAAYRLLATTDFHKITLHRIVTFAQVSNTAVYHWWQSRDEILFDAVTEHIYPVLPIPQELDTA